MTNEADKPSVEGMMPCPFCGGGAVHGQHGSADEGYYAVECPACRGLNNTPFAGVHGDSFQECAAAWNRRASAAAPAAQPATPLREVLSDEIRRQFDVWAQSQGMDIERGSFGPYKRLGTNQAFSGWLGRALLAASSDEDRKLMEQALDAIESAERYGAGNWPSLCAAIRSRLEKTAPGEPKT